MPDWVPAVMGLWMICRNHDGPGLVHLPDAGGPNDQSPFVLDCFAILERALEDWTMARKSGE